MSRGDFEPEAHQSLFNFVKAQNLDKVALRSPCGVLLLTAH